MQAYNFKHMSLDLYIVRTNLNPRTIMRSPGFINSVMVRSEATCPQLDHTEPLSFSPTLTYVTERTGIRQSPQWRHESQIQQVAQC